MLQTRLGISQRRACQIVGQHRSTQRHARPRPTPIVTCGSGCGASPSAIRGGAIGERTPCWAGRTIKILHVVDEFTRESLADLVDHSATPTPPLPASTRSPALGAGIRSSSAADSRQRS